MPYFVSFGHFEHLLALICVAIYTWQHQLEPLFNLLTIILKLLHSCISAFIAWFEGEMQSLGSSLISACVNKGEKFSTLTMTQGGRNFQFHLKLRDMHSFERDCTCSGGVAFEVFCWMCWAFASSGGSSSFSAFRALLVVLSPLPLLEG